MTTNSYNLPRLTLLYLKPPKNLNARQKVIVMYRYISWFITSTYYLAGPPYNSFKYKLAVVIALFVFSRVTLDFYLKSSDQRTVRLSVIAETMALTVLLIPTGGLESPFIWYAFNPILIASNYLEGIYCWIGLFFYLFASLLISLNLFNRQALPVFEFIQDKSYVILIYILVTVVLRLLALLVKQLDQQAKELEKQKQELVDMNEELQHANLRINRSMGYVMSLYHIIETFSSREDVHSILNQMVNSTAQVMECKACFVLLNPYKDQKGCFITQGVTEHQVNILQDFLRSHPLEEKKRERESSFELEGVSYLVAPIKSASRHYGYMGMVLSDEQQVLPPQEGLSKPDPVLLGFLADLVALILERHHLQELASKLIVLEEQNRIANEIHDSVSQRLFSILCAIHTLKENWHRLDAKTISTQLELIGQSTKDTSKELRTTIYRLSTSKRGEKLFKDNIESYLQDFRNLNNVMVSFKFDGSEEQIPFSLKQVLYRIVREATGNAVRHGKCSELAVQISICAVNLELWIKDNGEGFDKEFVYQNKANRGLGLNNMQLLAQTFNGSFAIVSSKTAGTELHLQFPLNFITELEVRPEGGAA